MNIRGRTNNSATALNAGVSEESGDSRSGQKERLESGMRERPDLG